MFNKCDSQLFWRKRVTIVVPDSTRPLDYKTTLEPLIRFLTQQESEIRFYVALGLHRPMNPHEMLSLFGLANSIGAKVKQHRPQSGALEQTKNGVAFHRRYILGADLIINVGVVEPHQYAGFSGGVKGLAIGCADVGSISRMHHMSHLKNPNVGIGKLENNIFQENLWKAVAGLPDIYGLFMVPGTKDVFFGEVKTAFSDAVGLAKRTHFQEHKESVAWMEVSVPESKSKNFYQASRAATYLALVEGSAIEKGGHILLDAGCPEKMGEGEGEKACSRIMKKGKTYLLETLQKATSKSPSLGGEQRAYVIAQALNHCQISVIGAPNMPELKAIGIGQFRTMEEAKSRLGISGKKGMHVCSPFHKIPVLAGIPRH